MIKNGKLSDILGELQVLSASDQFLNYHLCPNIFFPILLLAVISFD